MLARRGGGEKPRELVAAAAMRTLDMGTCGVLPRSYPLQADPTHGPNEEPAVELNQSRRKSKFCKHLKNRYFLLARFQEFKQQSRGQFGSNPLEEGTRPAPGSGCSGPDPSSAAGRRFRRTCRRANSRLSSVTRVYRTNGTAGPSSHVHVNIMAPGRQRRARGTSQLVARAGWEGRWARSPLRGVLRVIRRKPRSKRRSGQP